MNDAELREELRQIAVDVFPSANSGAVQDGIGRLLRILGRVDPAKYRELWTSLYMRDASIKEYDPIVPIPERLEKLAIRLGDEGRYVDENICFGALEIIQNKA